MNIKKELELIRTNYDKTIDLVYGLPFSQKQEIRMIEFYSNSEYLIREEGDEYKKRPFMQILNAICDVENAAKDVNTSDIQITSDDSNHYLESWLLSKDVYVWMKETNFAKTLNDMRDIHTRYGSLLVKKCIKDHDKDGEKELNVEMPEWKNLITDQVDIINGAIIETHWMTSLEIAKKKDAWNEEAINELLKKFRNLGSTSRCPIYEIRGEFPKAYLKDLDNQKITEKDEINYSYQLHIIAGNPLESGTPNNYAEAVTPLYWEDDTEKIYKYLARKPKAGRAFGVGVFKEGEQAQIWTNDAVLKQQRAMEYTTKVIGQTASKKLKGRNLLTETDDGTILETEENKPITALNLLPSGGLAQYNNLISQWYSQLEKTTSAYAAQRGETPNSGTPFRLQATVLQQSSSVFKTLQQEFGIFITEIIEDWVLPHLATKLSKEHLLAYDFSPEELKEIDKKFAAKNANKIIIDRIISGGLEKLPTQEDYDKLYDAHDTFIKQTKSQRFIKIPKDFYKNLKAKVTVNVTGEQRNKAATLESLNNILTVYASNPNLSADPVASQLLARIIELSGAGISPVSITSAISEKNKNQQAMQAQLAQNPQQQGQPSSMSLQANPQSVATQ